MEASILTCTGDKEYCSDACRMRAPVSAQQVLDANGQSLAYVYARENRADADTAGVRTMDEARRIANNIAKLPTYLAANPDAVSE